MDVHRRERLSACQPASGDVGGCEHRRDSYLPLFVLGGWCAVSIANGTNGANNTLLA
jgi:hypothetical protein